MFEYNVDFAEGKKYIQVNCMKFFSYIKKNYGEKERELIFQRFSNHHCDVYRNESMFVFERFFWNREDGCEMVWGEIDDCNNTDDKAAFYLKKYLENHGFIAYQTPELFEQDKVECIFPGYAGILISVSW